jgi:dTDP-4-amino-4,6-dideoxygalactose transaminase
VWHLFVIASPDRDALRDCLLRAGIDTVIHYPVPPYRAPAYRELGCDPGMYSITERVSATVVSLPMGPHLARNQVQQVALAIRNFAAGVQ